MIRRRQRSSQNASDATFGQRLAAFALSVLMAISAQLPLAVAFAPAAHAATTCTTDCYVDAAAGNDANDGTEVLPLATIQAGITAVTAGGTVHVANGTYSGQLLIAKGVTIVGNAADPSQVILDGGAVTNLATPGQIRLNTPAAAVSIQGLTVRNIGGNAGGEYYAFMLKSANPITIDSVRVIGRGSGLSVGDEYGLWAYNNTGALTITNTLFRQMYHAILLERWNGAVTIQNNTFDDLYTDLLGAAGPYGGRAIEAMTYGAFNVTAAQKVLDNRFTNFRSTGIVFSGGFSGSGVGKFTNVEIAGNTFDFDASTIINGHGAVFLANVFNGAPNNDVNGGVTATVHNNYFNTPPFAAVKVLGLNGAISVTGNAFADPISGTPATAAMNLSGALSAVTTTGNWWGQASGPAAGQITGTALPWAWLASGTSDPTSAGKSAGAPGFWPTGSLDAACTTNCYVNAATGLDTNGGGINAPFKTIAKGIAMTTEGGTVNVASGTYHEHNLLISKSLTLLGDPGDSAAGPGANAPVLDGDGTLASPVKNDGFQLASGVHDVTISGFVIQNLYSTLGDNDGTGVAVQAYVNSTSNVTVSDNLIQNVGYGVLVGNDADYGLGTHSGWSVTRNVIQGFLIGIELTDASNSSATANVIHMTDHTLNGETFHAATALWSYVRTSQSNLTFSGNTIDGALDPAFAWAAFPSGGYPAILVWTRNGDQDANLSNLTISNNDITVTGTAPKIFLLDSAAAGRPGSLGSHITSATIQNNSFTAAKAISTDPTGITSGGIAVAATLNVTSNWWGQATGPAAGQATGNLTTWAWLTSGATTGVTPGFWPTGAPDVQCTTTCYVNTATGSDSFGGSINAPFKTIGKGLTSVSSGGTVHVAAGTYAEALSIGKSVTILGPNAAISPNTGSRVAEAIIKPVAGATAITSGAAGITVVVKGITLDLANMTGDTGAFFYNANSGTWTFEHDRLINDAGGAYYGPFWNTSSSATTFNLLDNLFQDNTNTSQQVMFDGSGISTVDIRENVFVSEYAWTLNLNHAQGTFADNTITAGTFYGSPYDIYQYGILLAGSSSNMALSHNSFIGLPIAVALYTGAEAPFGGTATVTGNLFTGSGQALRAGSASVLDLSGVSFTGNSLVGGIISNAQAGTIAATGNWWGQATGPAAGQITGSVTSAPWIYSYTPTATTPGFWPEAVVASSAPANTVAPSFTGTRRVGSLQTATDGTWTGLPAPSYGYVWERSADGSSGWAAIGSATASTYTLTASDAGKYVRVTVTATNGMGAASASSAARGPMAAATAVTLYVNAATGNNGNDCLAADSACATIPAAIGKAVSGDTISVAAGTYAAGISVTKSLTIIGDPGDSAAGPAVGAPIIDGAGAAVDGFDLANGVSNVTIRGFEVRNLLGSGSINGNGVGVQAWVPSTSNITVSDNWFHDIGYAVMAGNDGSEPSYALGTHTGWSVANNIIEKFSDVGVELTNTSSSSVTGNAMHLTAAGALPAKIAIFSSAYIDESGLTISGNSIDGTQSAYPVVYVYALDAMTPTPNLNNVLIENNSITSTGATRHIYVRNIGGGTVTGVHVHNNNIVSLKNLTAATIDATGNYWGSAVGPILANAPGSLAISTWIKTYSPDGTKAGQPGFWPTSITTGPWLSAYSGTIGSTVTFNGAGFTSGMTVTFGGGVTASYTVDSESQIIATVPAGAVSGVVTVAGGTFGTLTSPNPFTLVPTISGFAPSSGPVGTIVTIFGTGFTASGMTVAFNLTAASGYTFVNSTRITAVVPSGSTTGKITVANAAGSANSASNFTVITAPVPTVTGVSPASGPIGATVTITGTGLSGATAVKFNGASASTFTVNSATSISAVVPAGATTGTVSVDTAGGTGTSASSFTVTALSAPTVATVNPSSGPTGTSVTLTGTNFSWVTGVKIGLATVTSYTVNSATSITAVVPAGAATGAFTVTNVAGTSSGGPTFTVTMTPTISGVSPASGPVLTSVVITGTGFTGVTVVRIGSIPVSYTVDSATQISATVPLAATTGAVSIVAAGGSVTGPTFTVTVPAGAPSISGFSPTSGPVGTILTVTGAGFTGATAVRFNGFAASTFAVGSDTQITVVVPAGATSGRITVTNPVATGVSPMNFAVLATPVPTVSSVSPSSGPVGLTVAITGTGFIGATAVEFNGTAASYVINSSTSITAVVPAGATTGAVAVTTSGGTGTSGSSFTVVALSAPTVTAVSPSSGSIGSAVTLTGTNFSWVTGVKIGLVSVTSYTVNSATSITAVIPTGASTAAFSVTNLAATSSSGPTFTVTAAPAISGISPTTGSVGTSVVITGTGFTGVAAVRFGAIVASYTVDSSTQITATVPLGAVTGAVTVITSGGSIVGPTFTVTVPAGSPTITGFTPSSGVVGARITVLGTGFTGVTAVRFNGVAATTFTVVSATRLTAVVPTGATTGRLSVTNGSGTGVSGSNFTVK